MRYRLEHLRRTPKKPRTSTEGGAFDLAGVTSHRLHRGKENLLDLVLVGRTRISEAAGILHGIGGQDRDVVGFGAQFGEAARNTDIQRQFTDGGDGRGGAFFRIQLLGVDPPLRWRCL